MDTIIPCECMVVPRHNIDKIGRKYIYNSSQSAVVVVGYAVLCTLFPFHSGSLVVRSLTSSRLRDFCCFCHFGCRLAVARRAGHKLDSELT